MTGSDMKRKAEIDAFLANIGPNGEGCLIWPFGRNTNGYGIRSSAVSSNIVSRVLCEKFHGAQPTPKHVAAHSCGKGQDGCVAPWHLSWKTHKENCDDMVLHGTRPRGVQKLKSKLTPAKVRRIRRLVGTVPYRKLGFMFGVSSSTVRAIVAGEMWSHVR